jgi:hypothetical protein
MSILSREPVLMPVWGWNTPAAGIPEQSLGEFRIIKRKVKAGTAWPMCGTLGYDYCVFMEEALLTILQERKGDEWRDWMVDSPYDWYAMGEYGLRTRPSKVIVGGLGLSLVLCHLVLRKDLEKITVIELNRDVIDMVSSHIPLDDRIEIIYGDFFDVVPELASKHERYDTLIMDMWTGEDQECMDIFKRAFVLAREHYPNSMHLFHSFQKLVDAEIVSLHLPREPGNSLRFAPENFSPEALRKRQQRK